MSAVINIKTDPEVKLKAQKVASGLGLSLSGVLNAYLREFVRTRTLHVSLEPEQPSEFLINEIQEAEEELRRGDVVSFDNHIDAIQYLHNFTS